MGANAGSYAAWGLIGMTIMMVVSFVSATITMVLL
jgi:hypothetical protein